MSVYPFKEKTIDGKEISLQDYQGKALLIVNVASKCGFTPQYEGLEKLYKKYKDQGFEILGFPCNQFGGQEPGNESDIQSFSPMASTSPCFPKWMSTARMPILFTNISRRKSRAF